MVPLVTVITPVYNCENLLRQSIESVKSQSYTNWEHIIVDDHSTDNTKQVIIKAADEDNRVKPVFLESNGGIANARNTAVSAAKGKYIAFLDSDDLWMPEKLEKHINYMEKNNIDFTYSNYKLIDYDGRFIKNIVSKKKILSYEELLNSNQIGCLTAVIRSDIIKQTMFPNMRHEDYATWLTILKEYVTCAEGLDEILAAYRKSNASASSNKLRTISWTWNVYRQNQNLGIYSSLKHLVKFEAQAAIKHFTR